MNAYGELHPRARLTDAAYAEIRSALARIDAALEGTKAVAE